MQEILPSITWFQTNQTDCVAAHNTAIETNDSESFSFGRTWHKCAAGIENVYVIGHVVALIDTFVVAIFNIFSSLLSDEMDGNSAVVEKHVVHQDKNPDDAQDGAPGQAKKTGDVQ